MIARLRREFAIVREWPKLCERDWHFMAQFLMDWHREEPRTYGGARCHYGDLAQAWLKHAEDLNELKQFRELQLTGPPL